jgi:hypothetical protein
MACTPPSSDEENTSSDDLCGTRARDHARSRLVDEICILLLIKGENLINRWRGGFLPAIAVGLSLVGCGGSGNTAGQGSSASGAEAPRSATSRSTESTKRSAADFKKRPSFPVPGRRPIPSVAVRPALSKAPYRARANAICKESIARMSASAKQAAGAPFSAHSHDIYLPGMQFWFDDIHYLGSPLGDAGQVEAMLQALQLDVWKGQEHGVSSAQRLTALFHDFSRLAHRYGLESCVVRPTSLPG